MPVTLTDEQVAAIRAQTEVWQRKAAIADRATNIWNDPRWSDRAKALWKEAYPEEPITDYDLEQRVNARFEQERKTREEEREKERQADYDKQIATGRDRAKQRGFTAEAVERMEKMMVEKGIRDYDDAMDLMAAREPRPADEIGNSGHFWNHDKQEEWKEVAKDPEQWGFEQIRRAVVADAQQRGIR